MIQKKIYTKNIMHLKKKNWHFFYKYIFLTKFCPNVIFFIFNKNIFYALFFYNIFFYFMSFFFYIIARHKKKIYIYIQVGRSEGARATDRFFLQSKIFDFSFINIFFTKFCPNVIQKYIFKNQNIYYALNFLNIFFAKNILLTFLL